MSVSDIVRVGDQFLWEYERDDGTTGSHVLPYIELGGEPWLVLDYAPWLHIHPEELEVAVALGVLPQMPRGTIRKVYDAETGETDPAMRDHFDADD